MKLEKWALIAEIVSGLAIVVTLAVLVLETSGNTAALRAATYQNVVDSVTRTLDMRVTDPEIERVWRMGLAGEELNDVDKDFARLSLRR